MYIHWNKIHGFHDIHNQFQSLHDFVYGVIGGLSSPNHHRAMSNRVMGESALKLADHNSDTLIHEVVQVGDVAC